jgi:hypothetical protein
MASAFMPRTVAPGATGPMTPPTISGPVSVVPRGIEKIPPVVPGQMSNLNTAQRMAAAQKLFAGVGAGMEEPATGQPQMSTSPQGVPMTNASPIPIALNLPSIAEIRAGFPSVTSRLFGGLRG